jgi:hypothetical protein
MLISLILGTFLQWIAKQWTEQQTQVKEMEDDDDDDDNDLQQTKRERIQQEADFKDQKKVAVTKQLEEYQQLQTLFASKDAKTWNEIPDQELMRTADKCHLQGFQISAATRPFDQTLINFRFNSYYSDVPSSKRDAYLSLFAMVWSGNVHEIKAMTLTRWGPNNENEPLKISVGESLFGYTLVMIVLQQKRFDLAKMLLQIAQVQYRPKEEKVNYFIERDDDSDNDSECDSEGSEYYIGTETVDNSYELGDVTHIPDEARSEITPLQLLRRQAKFLNLIDAETRRLLSSLNPRCDSGTALTLALIQDDFDAFVKILDLADEFDSGIFPQYGSDIRWCGSFTHSRVRLQPRPT